MVIPEQFIARWKSSGASERANYQLFLSELCELLGVEKPRPASDKVTEAFYTFERPVVFDDGDGRKTTNFIDLYKQHCFVLEAKQGSDVNEITEAEQLGAEKVKTKIGTAKRGTRSWDREMKKAKEQALRYARSLPAIDGWPPFVVIVDVGYCIDLYADFTRQGKTYIPFPGPVHYRITLDQLIKEDIQDRLRLLFNDPLQLDPSKRSAKVTRELAERLAKLAALLEKSGHAPDKVAGFLMRCLFTMFAEDVHLLPDKSFTTLLQDYKEQLHLLPKALQSLWTSMDKGGFDPSLRSLIPQFNGFLFKDPEALPITSAQADLLILAAQADWGEVEPAIFGTLLERALHPRERHKLGAHYTPRAYVERLVIPTVIEPLREEWQAARTASVILETSGDDQGALQEINKFHRRLCSVRILDPACGSGNFLYVTLEHLKRLEGEVAEYLTQFSRQLLLDMTGGYTVTPGQFLGLEVNPRAAAIADVVLWIGYLQWHFRAHGNAKRLEDPILRHYGNIQLKDAVLDYKRTVPRVDEDGEPLTRWNGHSTKKHAITGLEVPDETARTSIVDYIDPQPATWPVADFIVGNPPFIGNKRMREVLGEGYTEALRRAYKNFVPESADFVMFWWFKSAQMLQANQIERFGLITTNSITQSFNRRVVQEFMESSPALNISYAIPNHPWVDSSDGADVRIAITVADTKNFSGRLDLVVNEHENSNSYMDVEFQEFSGLIHADLKIGANVASTVALTSNKSVSSFGMMLAGKGFIVNREKAIQLGMGKNPALAARIRPFRNGRDLTSKPRGVYLIDMFPLEENDVRDQFPEVYQHLISHVKPERDQNNRPRLKEKWWLFGESRQGLRAALVGLSRYISTPETAKHRFFVFQDISILPDHKLVNIAVDDYYHFGILSSKIHVLWATAAGGRLGVGNDPVYNTTRCFQTFPFPIATNLQEAQIRQVAEKLDKHRMHRLQSHPNLTLTDMYNVLEKVNGGDKLGSEELQTHEEGLIAVLQRLHQELDLAVTAAYAWPLSLSEDAILQHLVALNYERANEEGKGMIRWLRPEFQNPKGQSKQAGLGITDTESVPAIISKQIVEWPKDLASQAQAVQRVFLHTSLPLSASVISKQFKKGSKSSEITRELQILHLLETLQMLGLLRKTNDNLFVR